MEEEEEEEEEYEPTLDAAESEEEDFAYMLWKIRDNKLSSRELLKNYRDITRKRFVYKKKKKRFFQKNI